MKKKLMKKLLKWVTGNLLDYTTGNLLDYAYYKKNCKLIEFCRNSINNGNSKNCKFIKWFW